MVPLTELWLPILLSAVIVFFASFAVWTILPHHRKDWRGTPDEPALRAAMLKQQIQPGQYVIPHAADPKGWNSPEMVQKRAEGPVGFLILASPGKKGMGGSLVKYFLYCVALSFFVAYLAGRLLGPGTPYLEVFRAVGTAAFLGYSGAAIPNAIWFSRSWSSTVKEMLDGLAYALLTAGTFGWLWPKG